jgi:hypothetical protein
MAQGWVKKARRGIPRRALMPGFVGVSYLFGK